MRSIATPPFEPALSPVPAGISSLYGPDAPFGTRAFAWRDAGDITSPAMPHVADPIPGWRASGSLWPNERFSIRIPHRWNGRLVVAGTPGQRTEFASDRLFADPLLARGYAYACGNKGNGDGVALLDSGARLVVDGVALPRYPVAGERAVSFWQHAPGALLERYAQETIELTQLARDVVRERCGAQPEATYAIGLSNGGYQVRRAIEQSDLFDGALTWNAVLWTHEHNLLGSLHDAIVAVAGGHPDALATFPPDVRAASGATSMYARHLLAYWYVTLWLHAVHLDPATSTAYGDVTDPQPAESWARRIERWSWDRPEIAARVERFANSGAIRCKTIDLCSEFDHLIPPAVHFEPYGRLVAAAGAGDRYRARTIRRAIHVDGWVPDPEYPRLQPGWTEVIAAFDELVAWCEGGPVKSP